VKWSVGIEAEGDKILSREQIVELADAIAASQGIATGIGASRYGAQLVVEAATTSNTTTPGKSTGSASTPRRLPARSRAAARTMLPRSGGHEGTAPLRGSMT